MHKKKRVTKKGYLMIYSPGHPVACKNGYAMEHRIIAYDAGILIDLSNDVHHMDHDKKNNNISNLMVISKGDHTKMHKTGRPNPRRNAGVCLFPTCDYPTANAYGVCKRHYDNLNWSIHCGLLKPFNPRRTIEIVNLLYTKYLFFHEFIRTGDMKPTRKYNLNKTLL